jgi:methylated-DNA-[protein]-cysteine S-methyltransferase
MTWYTKLDSPIGKLLLISDGSALIGLYMDNGFPDIANAVEDACAFPLPLAIDQLNMYFAGRLKEFTVPLRLHGTDFQILVWRELQNIAYGQTISYGEQARRISRPQASRAVGLANGKNPISIIVPCHRVIGANGTLTGYGGGLTRKQFLLNLEAQHARTQRQLSVLALPSSHPT